MSALISNEDFLGGIIADEMGLGKTGVLPLSHIYFVHNKLIHSFSLFPVETLGIITEYLAQDDEEVRSNPILILSPTDLVAKQWADQTIKFTRGIKVVSCLTSDVCRLIVYKNALSTLFHTSVYLIISKCRK